MLKITCPNCGAEYAPQEIFLFNSFNESNIIKNEHGELISDVEIDDEESYKCDYCNQTFYVKMTIDFIETTYKLKPYVTKLHKPALFLNED